MCLVADTSWILESNIHHVSDLRGQITCDEWKGVEVFKISLTLHNWDSGLHVLTV